MPRRTARSWRCSMHGGTYTKTVRTNPNSISWVRNWSIWKTRFGDGALLTWRRSPGLSGTAAGLAVRPGLNIYGTPPTGSSTTRSIPSCGMSGTRCSARPNSTSETPAIADGGSFDTDARLFSHSDPPRDFLMDEAGEGCRRAADGLAADCCELLYGIRLVDDLVELATETSDYRARRSGGRQDPVPRDGAKASERLGDGRQLGCCRGVMRAGGSKSAQRSVADHRQSGDDRRQHDLSLVIGNGVERGCTPVERSMCQVDAGRDLEQLKGELGRATEAAR